MHPQAQNEKSSIYSSLSEDSAVELSLPQEKNRLPKKRKRRSNEVNRDDRKSHERRYHDRPSSRSPDKKRQHQIDSPDYKSHRKPGCSKLLQRKKVSSKVVTVTGEEVKNEKKKHFEIHSHKRKRYDEKREHERDFIERSIQKERK